MPATFLKKDRNKSVFLWILGNFQEHLIYRRPQDNCFWPFDIQVQPSRFIFKIVGKLIYIYSHRNHHKTYGFLRISWE